MYLEIYFILFIFAVYVYPISCIDNNNNNNETQFLFQLHKVKLPKKDTRLRKLFPNMTKVYGNTTELNYYFINMQVGLPPVKQSLIVDTGSQLTAIPCGSKCPTCGSHSNVFYELKNESKIVQCDNFYFKENPIGKCSSDNKCMFYNKYAEESTLEGFFFEEYINFGLDENVGKGGNVIMGCTTKESNLFYEQMADGIMGLGNSDMSFTSMLSQRKIIPDNIFSLCLSNSEGYFSLGKYFNWTNLEEMKNTTLLNYQNKYGANLTLIIVNYTGDYITINKDIHTIIDSGSTLSMLPRDIFDQFNKLFLKNCNNETICNSHYINDELGACIRFVPKRRFDHYRALITMPNISFVFENHTLYDLTSDEYYYYLNYKNRTVDLCTGFGVWNKSMILLGSNFMHEHNFAFNKRTNVISFARSNCWDVAYYYRRDTQKTFTSQQRANNRSVVIVRHKTNVTLIINGEDDELYFELSSEQQMMIAIGSALVFVIVLILLLHFCCGGKGEDEDIKGNNETTHSQIIELASQSTDTEEEDKKEEKVENKDSKKSIGVLRVKKNFEKLII